MVKIAEKKVLSCAGDVRVIQIRVLAPDIAARALPGEFVVFMVGQKGERVPLTVVEADRTSGLITLVFQEAGYSTRLLGALEEGREIFSLSGPLGNPTPVEKHGTVFLVGGGVGIAELYPVARALKSAGNRLVAVLGARGRDLLILRAEMESVCGAVHFATDDGSLGHRGFVSEVLARLLSEERPALVYAVGPLPMMKAVSSVTRPLNVKTVVSLNALMVDGTGMCGGCRVTVGGKMKFVCLDGPEFEADQVDWDELSSRSGVYREQERHICRLLSR